MHELITFSFGTDLRLADTRFREMNLMIVEANLAEIALGKAEFGPLRLQHIENVEGITYYSQIDTMSKVYEDI
jgi:hypothetical protein